METSLSKEIMRINEIMQTNLLILEQAYLDDIFKLVRFSDLGEKALDNIARRIWNIDAASHEIMGTAKTSLEAIEKYGRKSPGNQKKIMTILIDMEKVSVESLSNAILKNNPELTQYISRAINLGFSDEEMIAFFTGQNNSGILGTIDNDVITAMINKIRPTVPQITKLLSESDTRFIAEFLVTRYFKDLSKSNFIGKGQEAFVNDIANMAATMAKNGNYIDEQVLFNDLVVRLKEIANLDISQVQRQSQKLTEHQKQIINTLKTISEAAGIVLSGIQKIFIGILKIIQEILNTLKSAAEFVGVLPKVLKAIIQAFVWLVIGSIAYFIINRVEALRKILPPWLQKLLGFTPNVETTEKVDFNNVPKELTGFLFTTWHGLDNTFNKESLSKFSYYKIGDNNWKIVVGKDKNGGDLYYLVEYNPETKQYKIQDAK